MAETRLITLNMTSEERTRIAEITGYHELNRAVGYLAAWNMTFGHVTIDTRADREIELIATYRKEPGGPVGYQIGAVWHDNPEDSHGGHFGFHS